MEQSKQFTLEDITYNMTPANAAVAWAALKNALKLVQHVDLSNLGNAGNIGANMLTAILANLGDPSIKALEDIVLKHTSCEQDGKQYRLFERFDAHFNQHRGHLLPVLKEGLVYQFADFFIGGGGLLSSMLPNLNQKAQ
uniref:Tail assembly chaperone protein n=1 Tax=Myoviridae sp. ctKZW4 TaxID=2826639 RepID=A0A8S5NAP4_9CAUD|nr:MAG TPA: tail assembly chaperone protein [Myoviridae sp. ctKZW4]